MPKGTPFWPKCPKCRRGMFGHPAIIRGTFAIGRVEAQITQSSHKGYGNGGRSFRGRRGIMKCHDCGHEWASTHPQSGRERV